MTDSALGIDTQSMLLDDAIGDDQLAVALVQSHASEFCWLAAILLSTSASFFQEPASAVRRIIADCFTSVVVNRERIWQQPSLRAWLARLVIRRCQRLERRGPFRWIAPQPSTTKRFPGKGNIPPAFLTAWDKMSHNERLAMLLHSVLGLSLAEIAWVFESEPYPVLYWVREGWRKISYEASKVERETIPAGSEEKLEGGGTTPFISLPPRTAPGEGETAMINAIRRLLPVGSLPPEELQSLNVEVTARIQVARDRRRATIAVREAVMLGLVLGALFFGCRAAGLLPKEIIHRYKTATPTIEENLSGPGPTPEAPFYFTYGANEGDTLEILAQRLGTTTDAIRSLNPYQFPGLPNKDLQPGVRLLLPASPEMSWRATSVPATPVPPLPPLTVRSDLKTILERMENQRLYWRTLWATVRETYYGPPGYLGPALSELQRQVWFSQPDRFLFVFRPSADQDIPYSIFYLNGFSFLVDADSKQIYGSYVGKPDGTPWYYVGFLTSNMQYSIFPTHLGHMGSYALQENHLEVVREEVYAGRQTLVLEGVLLNGTRRVRLWVDALTGMVLRRLDYSTESPGVILREAGVLEIVFDADFPADVFNPRQPSIRGFVRNPSGTPVSPGQDIFASPSWSERVSISLQPDPVPPGFDLASQPVFLQWPESWDQAEKTSSPGSSQAAPTAGSSPSPSGSAFPKPGDATSPDSAPRIRVFADQYYLGSLPLEGVNFGDCQRSPDGRLIALRAFSNSAEVIPSGLYWFSLEGPEMLHTVCQGCNERPFAFSPDSRRLAYSVCRELSSPPGCSISIYDLPTGNQDTWQISNDIGEAYPMFLAWIPDSRYLAILALVENWAHFEVKILDLQTGEITYSGAYDPVSGTVPPDSPMRDWNLTFPPYDEIEMGCMEP